MNVFFQAEDGIRDTSVTGVQTCALPIYQATAAALEADWPRAVELNQKLVETSPEDLEARNRLGRAFIELGRLDEAKAAFAEVLKIEPYNSIALRGNSRVATLQEHKRSEERRVGKG